MKRIFDYLPFFIVALFAVTIVFPKFVVQKNNVFGANHSQKIAIERVVSLTD